MQSFNDFINEKNTLEEISYYTRIPASRVNLPFDIYVDNYKVYKAFNHTPYIYVNVNNIFVPISISDKPKIESNFKMNDSQFKKIKSFILNNKSLLLKHANSELDDLHFFNSLKINESEKINEMSVLRASVSGVPFDIWLDDTMRWKNVEHKKMRLKIKDEESGNATTGWIPVIFEPPYLPEEDVRLDSKKMKYFKTFVEDPDNNKNLKDLFNNKITFEDFLKKINKLDKKGNIIKNSNSDETTV